MRYVLSQKEAIPIPITTIGMRLPPSKINAKRVAASKPEYVFSLKMQVFGPKTAVITGFMCFFGSLRLPKRR